MKIIKWNEIDTIIRILNRASRKVTEKLLKHIQGLQGDLLDKFYTSTLDNTRGPLNTQLEQEIRIDK